MARRPFEVIDNRGPNTLRAVLRKLLPKTGIVEIQVAFISLAGLDLILPGLRRATSVKLITGLYQGITEPRALRRLLEAQRQTGGRVCVRISRDAKLHRKLYLLRRSRAVTVICGSSNLTVEGLKSRGELNVLVRLIHSDPALRSLSDGFQAAWSTRNSVALSSSLITRYENSRPSQPRPTLYPSSLRAILGAGGEPLSDADEGSRPPAYWRDHVDGFVASKTEDVIDDETDWDDRGYEWYSGSSRYRAGDRILLLDRSRKTYWARLVEVVDVTRTSVATPDGRYFAAYRPVRRAGKKRILKKFWRYLEAAGLKVSRSRRYTSHRLSEERWKAIRKQLKI